MKRTLTLIITLFACTYCEVTFTTEYNRTAQILDILDNIAIEGIHSSWEFKEYWKDEFRISEEDSSLFHDYNRMRRKYWSSIDTTKTIYTNSHGLFSDPIAISQDPIKTIFNAAPDIDTALQQLESFVDATDLLFLKNFLERYNTQVMSIVTEFEEYAPDIIETITNTLDTSSSVQNNLDKMCRFYGVDDSIEFKILVHWWPRVRRGNTSSCTVRGDALIIRTNDSRRRLQGDNLTSIILHETSHAVEINMNQQEKRRLSDLFLESVTSDTLIKYLSPWRIYEPLAVTIGQMKFLKDSAPDEFTLDENWYSNKWINYIAPKIFPIIEPYLDAGTMVDANFMREVAAIYSETMELALQQQ